MRAHASTTDPSFFPNFIIDLHVHAKIVCMFLHAKFHACSHEYSFTWHAITCMVDFSDTCVCIYTMACVYTHFSENYV